MRASGRARAKRRIAGCAILVALALLAYWIRSSSEVPADVAAEPPSPDVSTTDVETVAETDPLASPPAERPAEPPLEHPAIRRFADLNRYSDDSRRIDEESYEQICRPTLEGSYRSLIDFLERCRDRIPEVTATVVALPGLDVGACEVLARELGVGYRIRPYNEVG